MKWVIGGTPHNPGRGGRCAATAAATATLSVIASDCEGLKLKCHLKRTDQLSHTMVRLHVGPRLKELLGQDLRREAN
jgi:hypothetical protein